MSSRWCRYTVGMSQTGRGRGRVATKDTLILKTCAWAGPLTISLGADTETRFFFAEKMAIIFLSFNVLLYCAYESNTYNIYT